MTYNELLVVKEAIDLSVLLQLPIPILQ